MKSRLIAMIFIVSSANARAETLEDATNAYFACLINAAQIYDDGYSSLTSSARKIMSTCENQSERIDRLGADSTARQAFRDKAAASKVEAAINAIEIVRDRH